MWNQDPRPRDADRDVAKRVSHGRHCDLSYPAPTLPEYLHGLLHSPPPPTKGALGVLDWNIVEMQTAPTLGISFVAGDFYQGIMKTALPVLNQGREHIRSGLHQH